MAIENIVQTQYSDDASIEYINTINARNDAELMEWGLPDEDIAEINRASDESVELTNRYTFKQFPKNDIPTTDVVNTQQTKTISDVPTMEDVPKTSAGRTIFYDSEGFPYSEKTETIQTKFGWVNTPTVNESGNQVNIDEIANWLNSQDSPIDFVTGRPLQVFNSSDEAVKVAQKTSDGYGNELQGQDKSMLEKGYEMLPEGGKKLVWPLIAPFVVGAKEESPLARGVFTGVIQDAPNAVLSLTRDIANALGANYTEEEYLQIPQLLQQSDSTTENITKTFSQFLSIFGAVGGFSKGSSFLGQMARGGFADSTFDPAMGNLGTVLKENNIWPELTQYWDSKVGEDATAFERLKARAVNSVEGGVLSAVVDLSIRAVKYAKNDPQLRVWMSNFLDKVDDLSRKLPETQMTENFGRTNVGENVIKEQNPFGVQMSSEALPSTGLEAGRIIKELPLEKQSQYQKQIDDTLGDFIEKEIGLEVVDDVIAPSNFEGHIGVSRQTRYKVDTYIDEDGFEKVTPESLDKIKQAAAMKGYLQDQDAVTLNFASPIKNMDDADQAIFDLGRPITNEEMVKVQKILDDESITDIALPSSKDGLIALNVSFGGIDNKKFLEITGKIADVLDIDADLYKNTLLEDGYIGGFEGYESGQREYEKIALQIGQSGDGKKVQPWGSSNSAVKQKREELRKVTKDFLNQNINSNTGKASVPAAVGVGEMSVSEENIQPTTVGKKPNAESVAAIATSQNPVDAAIKYIGLREKDTEGEQAIRNFFNNAVEGDFAPGTSDTDLARKNAWCAAFLSQVLTDSGYDTNIFAGKDKYQKLRAKEYRNIGSGVETSNAKPGDIMIKMHSKEDQKKYKLKPNSGHVGIVVKVEGDQVFFIGGNTGDKVEISSYNYKEKNVTIRRIKGISDIPKKTSDLYLDFQGSAGKKVRQIKNWFKEL